jgi:hypothetical protein
MNRRCTIAAVGPVLVAVAMAIFSSSCLAQSSNVAPELQRIGRSQLCVTNGVVTARDGGSLLSVETPSSRAVVPGASARTAEIRFRYLGPSANSKPLASGELRRQIGLKLRAQDTCNLLYAMWHIEPDSRLAVSIKRNAGMHTHQQCGASGYTSVKGRETMDLPKLRAGEYHTFRAELRGDRLALIVDGKQAWDGSVGPTINEFDGSVGFRTDNARFEFEYMAALGDPTARFKPIAGSPGCVASQGD